VIIHRIEPGGTVLYLQFQYHKPSVQKLQELRRQFGRKKINWNDELEGWVFDIELLYEVKELFPNAFIYDEDLKIEYEKIYRLKHPRKMLEQRRKADILKLF